MPKPIVNNKITYQNIYGRIIQFQEFLNQGVRTNDSPTFANLQLTGDATIEGNLYVEGNTTILDTNVIEFEDNIILLNRLETGSGVTLNQSGFEVERGSLENYRFVYNDPDGTFRIGLISNQQAVATRQDSPLQNGLMMWNNAQQRLDSRNAVSIDLSFTSTTNSTSSTTGSLKISGGLGIEKDITMNGTLYLTGNSNINKSSIYTNSTTNSLNLTSTDDINLTPSVKITIPYNIPLTFGSSGQKISANSINNNLDIYANGNINLAVPFGQRITIPNQIPITFSTSNEKIYADDSNNMIIMSSQDVRLTPATGKKVLIPTNIPMAFGSSTQYISSNLLNDLNVQAGNNIYITPGTNLNAILPFDTGMKFGSTGLQRIYANNSNQLYILSTSDLFLNSSSYVRIPTNIPLAFGSNYKQFIKSNTSGNLLVDSEQGLQIVTTINSVSVDSGSLVVKGGVGIEKDVHIGGNLSVYGTTVTLNTETILVEDNLIIVNNTPLAMADGGLLIKRFADGISSTNGNVYAGFFYKESTDEFTFGYTQTPSNTVVNVSDYIPLRSGQLHIMSDTDVIDFTTGSFTTLGGGYIGKNLIVNQNVTVSNLQVNNNINVVNLISTITTIGNILITSTENASDLSSGSIITNGGASISKDILVNGIGKFINTSISNNSSTGSIVNYGGLGINCTEDSSSFTNGGALTIAGGVSIQKNLYISGEIISNTKGTFNQVLLTSTQNSSNYSSGSIISYGGISIVCSSNSISVTNGGSLTVAGGASFAKDVYVGETAYVNSISTGNLSVANNINYSGNGSFITLNNTNESKLWYYIGKLNNESEGYSEIDFANSIKQNDLYTSHSYGLKTIFSIHNGIVSFTHNHYGDIPFDNSNKLTCYIYKDNTNDYHLFANLPDYSVVNINVKTNQGPKFIFVNEGLDTLPNGTLSNFDNLTWTEIYNSNKESNLKYTFGDVTVEGTDFKTSANLPIIGYNNINTNESKHVGILLQRYQKANNTGLGDVVNNMTTPLFTDILPNQSTSTTTQIKFSNSANSTDDYYKGWWIKVTSGNNIGQVRRIASYNGSQRVAEIETKWYIQNPSQNDSINLYGYQNVAFYYDEASDFMKLCYTSDENVKELRNQDYTNLQLNNLVVSSTQTSDNSSTGSLVSYGGISIACTKDAVNISNGGSFLTMGGATVNKNLMVGDNIYIGSSDFATDSNFNINKSNATVTLQNNLNGYSYVNFVESDSNSRFGVLTDHSDDVLAITYTNDGFTPNNAEKLMTFKNTGFIGIGTTTNINSLITLGKNNYISSSLDDGFIGVNGGNTTSGSKITLYGNNHSTDPNNIIIDTYNNGSLILKNNTKINQIIDNSGNVSLFSTTSSTNLTTGSLLLNGGMSIMCSVNSLSSTNGGTLTIAGGAGIVKDVYVGGNIDSRGTITANGFTNEPSLAFSNTQGCSIISYDNNKLIRVNNERLLSVCVVVSPLSESQNCQFEFDLPERINDFINRSGAIISCSGYTDDTELYTLFNTLGVASTGSKKATIKFQSASTGLHYLLITCRYTAN